MRRLEPVLRAYANETARALRSDAPIYLGVLAYLAIGTGYVVSQRAELFGDFADYATGCLLACCVVLPYAVLVIGIARVTLRLRRRRRLAYRLMFAPRRVARFLAGTVLASTMLVLFEAMYTSVKTAFSNGSFLYDQAVADMDAMLHFGHAPVSYLLALAGNSQLLRAVEFNYHEIWLLIWFGVLYWVATSPRAEGMRLRYCLTFILVWSIVGSLVAGLVPTAGPAYYGLVTGDTARFADLGAFLTGGGAPTGTAATQRYLWALHASGHSGLGSGISAFPSMHVATVAMNALFLAERGGRAALAGLLYTLFIMASSVYLGWHYAVDGYAAVLLTVGIWWAMRRLVPLAGRPRSRRPRAAGSVLAPPVGEPG